MTGPTGRVFPWNEERMAEATRLFLAGSSATEVAKAVGSKDLGYPTRNAVIAKLHRLGVKRPTSTSQAAMALSTLNMPMAGRPRPQPAAPNASEGEATSVRADLIPLAPKTLLDPAFDAVRACRWPLPNPAADGQVLFCCNDRGSLRPYCAGHLPRSRQRQRTPAQIAADEARREKHKRAAAAKGFRHNALHIRGV